MERISYVIFIPDGKKFHLTPNWLVGILWVVTAVLFYFFEEEGVRMGTSATIWVLAVVAISIFYGFQSYFTYKPLYGTLKGELEFENGHLIINEEIFELKAFSAIDFSFGDFYGQFYKGRGAAFNSRMSQGVDNYITLTDDKNQSRVIYFQIQSEHGYLELTPFIKEAIKANKMPIQRGIDLVGRENIVS